MTVKIGNISVNANDILAKVNEFEILYYYLSINTFPIIINSPLRKDNHASFAFYVSNNKGIRWYDFAYREGGDLFSFLSKYWKLNFSDTISKIYKDLPNIISSDSHKTFNLITTKALKIHRSDTKLKCRTREWQTHDIEYWKSYGISIDWLKFADIYPISHKIIIEDGIERIFPAEKYAYAYVEFKEGKVTLKIYQPFSKYYKWANKHDKSVISLWTKVPEYGDKICICSSMKDALCLWANTGIPSIAVQGEGYNLSETAVRELKRRYNTVYILFDNDETGLKDGVSLSKETNFNNVILPPFEGGKDVSDLMKVKGLKEFRRIILPLFD